jgi:hypothetical protein
MTILAELFNPSFFMLLAILLLVASMFVIYYESKMREQNHTINSMLSLVSTLAEDMNNVKFGLNQLSIRYSQPSANNFEEVLETSKIIPNYNLIEVSDDESDEEDEEDEEDEDDEEEDEESSHSSSSDSDDFECNIKVLKLNILNEADLDECEMTLTCDLDESATKDDDKYLDELDGEMAMKLPLSDELKTIAIDLGEEQVDYSKIPISKLKKIAVEKGIENVSKLKKQELIELLEVHL